MIDDVHLSNPNRSAESAPRASAGGGGRVFGASKVGSLGSITKSYSADINDTQKRRGLTIRRFALKAVSSNILPDSRTAKCMRWRAPNQQVEVWRAVSAGVAGKAFFRAFLFAVAFGCAPFVLQRSLNAAALSWLRLSLLLALKVSKSCF